MLRQTILLWGCLLVASDIPFAQFAVTGLPVPTRISLPIAPWSPAPVFGSSATGELTGNLDRDIAIVVDDQLVVMVDVAVYQAPVQAGPARDLCVYPATQAGATDRLLVQRANGIHLLEWAGPGSATWTPGSPALFAESSAIRGPAFQGHGPLRVGHLPGSQGRGFAAVGTDGTSIRRVLRAADGSFVDGGALSFAAPVRDFVFVDLEADGRPELAVLTSIGLEILRPDGSLLYRSSDPVAGGAIASVRRGDLRQEVAWLRTNAQGNQWISTFDANGRASVAELLGPLGAMAMSACDYDDDGDDDLVITPGSGDSLEVLLNLDHGGTLSPAPFVYGPGTRVSLSLGLAPSVTASLEAVAPATMDMDNDGDIDILHPINANGMLAMFSSQIVAELDQAPEPWTIYFDAVTQELVLGFIAPSMRALPATHIQVVAHANSGGATPAKSNPYATLYAVAEPGVEQLFTVSLGELFEGTRLMHAASFFNFRFVRDEGGVLAAAWKAQTLAVVPGSVPELSQYVLGLPGFAYLDYFFGPGGGPNGKWTSEEGDGTDEGQVGAGVCTPLGEDLPPLPPEWPPPAEGEGQG